MSTSMASWLTPAAEQPIARPTSSSNAAVSIGCRCGGSAAAGSDVEDLQAIVQSSRKSPRSFASRRSRWFRNHAGVRLEQSRAAQPLELPLFQHAQKCGLSLRTHLADLVEKQARPNEAASICRVALVGSGERPALVAEEFRLEEGLSSAAQLMATNGPSLRGDAR